MKDEVSDSELGKAWLGTLEHQRRLSGTRFRIIRARRAAVPLEGKHRAA